jgi:hypothetical protein
MWVAAFITGCGSAKALVKAIPKATGEGSL